MMIKELGGNSTVFDKAQMKRMDPNKPIEIGGDGRAMQQDLDRDEI